MTTPKTRSRKYGQGSVYQRADGRWVASLEREPASGGRRRRRSVYRATKTDANRALRTLIAAHEAGDDSDDRRLTVEQFCDSWLRWIAPLNCRESTVTHYRWLLEHYAMPELGHIRLVALTAQHVGALLIHLGERGLSVSTRRQVRVALHSVVGQAVAQGLLRQNPVSQTPRPALATKDRQGCHDALTVSQVQVLLAGAKGSSLEGPLTVAIGLGLRQGEILGLHWSDIDLDRKTLQVNRTLKPTRLRQPDGSHRVVPQTQDPKTPHSRRRLGLTGEVVAALRSTRQSQVMARLAAGNAWKDLDYVFTTATGTAIDASNLRYRFKRLLTQCELPSIRFHDLRHTAANLMLQAGAPLEAVSEALGHSSIQITKDIYAPHVPGLADRAVEALNELLTSWPDLPTLGDVTAADGVS